jgi:mannose-6-phosphate isomerase-like protein (cupin superfamily)
VTDAQEDDVMADKERRRGITVFRATDAVDLEKTDFMTYAPQASEDASQLRRSVGAQAAAGSQVKVLVRDAGGFSLVHAWFKANYPLPRHSHDVDCMYYVISGAAVMGRQTLRAGDSFFVPAGAPYQYTAGAEGVEVLEVRHGIRQFDIKIAGDDPGRWKALAEAAASNGATWEQQPTSPTFAANAT